MPIRGKAATPPMASRRPRDVNLIFHHVGCLHAHNEGTPKVEAQQQHHYHCSHGAPYSYVWRRVLALLRSPAWRIRCLYALPPPPRRPPRPPPPRRPPPDAPSPDHDTYGLLVDLPPPRPPRRPRPPLALPPPLPDGLWALLPPRPLPMPAAAATELPYRKPPGLPPLDVAPALAVASLPPSSPAVQPMRCMN